MAKYEIKSENRPYYRMLEIIRETGDTNMYGAAPYLKQLAPELTNEQCKEILIEWMENYSELLEQGYFTRNMMGAN